MIVLSKKIVPLDKSLREYSVLRDRIREVLILGQKRIEREFMMLRWETGKMINDHIRLNEDRLQYGGKVLLKLEKDLGVHNTDLFRFSKFARVFPMTGRGQSLRLNLVWRTLLRDLLVSHG